MSQSRGVRALLHETLLDRNHRHSATTTSLKTHDLNLCSLLNDDLVQHRRTFYEHFHDLFLHLRYEHNTSTLKSFREPLHYLNLWNFMNDHLLLDSRDIHVDVCDLLLDLRCRPTGKSGFHKLWCHLSPMNYHSPAPRGMLDEFNGSRIDVVNTAGLNISKLCHLDFYSVFLYWLPVFGVNNIYLVSPYAQGLLVKRFFFSQIKEEEVKTCQCRSISFFCCKNSALIEKHPEVVLWYDLSSVNSTDRKNW